jgi:hypothetical protein
VVSNLPYGHAVSLGGVHDGFAAAADQEAVKAAALEELRPLLSALAPLAPVHAYYVGAGLWVFFCLRPFAAFASPRSYKLNPVGYDSMKAPGFKPCAYEVETWFQAFAFKLQLVCAATSGRPELPR